MSAERLGIEIRVEYIRRGLKQSDIAAACGVSQSTVSLWVRGEAEPTASQLIAIDGLFEKPAGWLLLKAGMIDQGSLWCAVIR